MRWNVGCQHATAGRHQQAKDTPPLCASPFPHLSSNWPGFCNPWQWRKPASCFLLLDAPPFFALTGRLRNLFSLSLSPSCESQISLRCPSTGSCEPKENDEGMRFMGQGKMEYSCRGFIATGGCIFLPAPCWETSLCPTSASALDWILTSPARIDVTLFATALFYRCFYIYLLFSKVTKVVLSRIQREQ